MRATLVLAASAAALVPVAASASETVTYGYDAKGRLVQVSHTGSINNGLTAVYAYDAADNRQSVTVSGASAVTPPIDPGNGGSTSPGGSSGGIVVVPLNGFTVIPLSRS